MVKTNSVLEVVGQHSDHGNLLVLFAQGLDGVVVDLFNLGLFVFGVEIAVLETLGVLLALFFGERKHDARVQALINDKIYQLLHFLLHSHLLLLLLGLFLLNNLS